MVAVRHHENEEVPGHSRLLARLLAVTALALASAVMAESAVAVPNSCHAGAAEHTLAVTGDWHVVVDGGTGLALLLPLDYQLAASGDVWYVYGMFDGIPLVPDMVVQRHVGTTVASVVAEFFGAASLLEAVQLGPASAGYRVRPGAGPTVDVTSGYVLVGGEDVYTVRRYERSDWDGFDAVACAVHLVEVLEQEQ